MAQIKAKNNQITLVNIELELMIYHLPNTASNSEYASILEFSLSLSNQVLDYVLSTQVFTYSLENIEAASRNFDRGTMVFYFISILLNFPQPKKKL